MSTRAVLQVWPQHFCLHRAQADIYFHHLEELSLSFLMENVHQRLGLSFGQINFFLLFK